MRLSDIHYVLDMNEGTAPFVTATTGARAGAHVVGQRLCTSGSRQSRERSPGFQKDGTEHLVGRCHRWRSRGHLSVQGEPDAGRHKSPLAETSFRGCHARSTRSLTPQTPDRRRRCQPCTVLVTSFPDGRNLSAAETTKLRRWHAIDRISRQRQGFLESET